jgi:hypothetical protein
MARKPSDLTVTDQFCGAGGSSIGAAAHGFRLRLAMNHWRVALLTAPTPTGPAHPLGRPPGWPATDLATRQPEEFEMKVQLLCRVPVAVVVDTDTAEVTGVVVLDTDIAADPADEVWDHDASRPMSDRHPALANARRVAEEQEWPSWEFGWWPRHTGIPLVSSQTINGQVARSRRRKSIAPAVTTVSA